MEVATLSVSGPHKNQEQSIVAGVAANIALTGILLEKTALIAILDMQQHTDCTNAGDPQHAPPDVEGLKRCEGGGEGPSQPAACARRGWVVHESSSALSCLSRLVCLHDG